MAVSKELFEACFTKLWLSLERYEEPAGKAQVYYSEMDYFSDDVIRGAFSQAIRNFQRFPTLEEMRALCYSVRKEIEPPPEEPEVEITEFGRDMRDVMLPYLSCKITGEEAYERVRMVYDKHGRPFDEKQHHHLNHPGKLFKDMPPVDGEARHRMRIRHKVRKDNAARSCEEE